MNWYFGIITDGKDNAMLKQVIRAIELYAGVQPVICGETAKLDTKQYRQIYAPDLARDGRLGAMRNMLIDERGDADIVVIMDDDIILHENFIQGFDKLGYNEWDIASCKILNPDGTRYWDWKVHRNGYNWLIPYDQTDRDISITGGLIVAKAHIFDKVCWNPALGFYEKEDVEFSDLLRRQGYKIAFNPNSTVTHMGPYTQDGDGVFRTDL